MESGAIKDFQLTATQGISRRPAIASRYNGTGWCTVGGSDYRPGTFDPRNYLQIDLLKDYTISSILLRGLKDDLIYSYGPKLKIQFQLSGSTSLQYYTDDQGRKVSEWLFAVSVVNSCI